MVIGCGMINIPILLKSDVDGDGIGDVDQTSNTDYRLENLIYQQVIVLKKFWSRGLFFSK